MDDDCYEHEDEDDTAAFERNLRSHAVYGEEGSSSDEDVEVSMW